MSELIYHLTLEKTWKEAQEIGSYSPPSLASEGFIHCSQKEQVLRVANNFFKDHSTVTLLVINKNRLISPVRWEPGTDKPDELFPHVFGNINLDAVERVYSMKQGKKGLFTLPVDIKL